METETLRALTEKQAGKANPAWGWAEDDRGTVPEEEVRGPRELGSLWSSQDGWQSQPDRGFCLPLESFPHPGSQMDPRPCSRGFSVSKGIELLIQICVICTGRQPEGWQHRPEGTTSN